MARLTTDGIIQALLLRVCESKNASIHLGRNYFVNIYRHIPGYYESFVKCTQNIFDIHGHEADAETEIEKYFNFKHINTSIN